MTEHNRQIDFILSANKSKKLNKDKGDQDLKQGFNILQKEVDTLKTIIDLKDVEINKLKEEAKDMLLYP
tara:strand:+ start:1481 stop:1687 length:207 start_codon:yes stop_codon:yes gene_type:complete